MNDAKYIGIDVHEEKTLIAVMNVSGKVLLETILETKSFTILQFVLGLRGSSKLMSWFGTDRRSPLVEKIKTVGSPCWAPDSKARKLRTYHAHSSGLGSKKNPGRWMRAFSRLLLLLNL
jgi:hypothetical protein